MVYDFIYDRIWTLEGDMFVGFEGVGGKQWDLDMIKCIEYMYDIFKE